MSEYVERRGKTTRAHSEDVQSLGKLTREESNPLISLASSFESAVPLDPEITVSTSPKQRLFLGLPLCSQPCSGTYPDTAESGQTYDMEADLPPKNAPV